MTHFTDFTLFPFGEKQGRPYTNWTWNYDVFQMTVLYDPKTYSETSYGSRNNDRNVRACYSCPYNRYPSGPNEDFNYILQNTCFTSATLLPQYMTEGNLTSERFGEINGTLTTCSLKPCAKQYSKVYSNGNVAHAQETHSTSVFQPAVHQPNIPDDDIPALRFLNEIHYCAEGIWIATVLESYEFNTYFMRWEEESSFKRNFTLLFKRMSKEISYLIQNPSNPDATNITGTAYGSELYVRVRWAWLILPLLTITMVIAILILSILNSSKKPYLLEDSILAALFFDVDGWDKKEYCEEDTWGRQSVRKMEEKATSMTARMELRACGDGGVEVEEGVI
ncbi:Nn.00g047160.m01.CDS01 [Neocucurbitaria sp. VM-36]